eukprot:g3492.t1
MHRAPESTGRRRSTVEEIEVFTQYADVLRHMFGQYAAAAPDHRGGGSHNQSHSRSRAGGRSAGTYGSDPALIDLRGLLQLGRDRGLCPGLLSQAEVSEIFNAVLLDTMGGGGGGGGGGGAARSPGGGPRRSLDFDGFLECLRRCALLLFTGKDWETLYPRVGDKARLLLFWMDQNNQLFVGNAAVLMDHLNGAAAAGAGEAAAAAAAAAAATPGGSFRSGGGRGGANGSDAAAAINALGGPASPAAAAIGAGAGRVPSAFGGCLDDELSFSLVSLGGGGAACGDHRVQLLPHLASMDMELQALFRHYASSFAGRSGTPLKRSRKAGGGAGAGGSGGGSGGGGGGGGSSGGGGGDGGGGGEGLDSSRFTDKSTSFALPSGYYPYGSSSGAAAAAAGANGTTLPASRFYKFVRQFGLLDKRLTHGDVDIIFKKVTGSGVHGAVPVGMAGGG